MMVLQTATGHEIECFAHFCPPAGAAHLILALTKAQASEVFEDEAETSTLIVRDGETVLATLEGYTQLNVVSTVEPGVKDKTRVSISKP